MTRVYEFMASERASYLLVAFFVLLGALYAVTTPIFEAGDEVWHYPVVQWIARGNGLPVQDPAQKQLWEQEGGQPPLYYALAAGATFWIDTGDLEERLWMNPYAKIGVPLAFGNKNLIVHTSAENFPWQGTTLAVHLIRLLSVCFSAGTVLLTYKIAREVAGKGMEEGRAPALIAAAVVAFNPMFLFISASVNNDSLAALLATGALLLTVQLVTRGVTNRRTLVLGVVVGLAILTKVSNLALGVVVVCVVGYCVVRQAKDNLSSLAKFLGSALLFLVPVAVIAGWWFARNYLLYGDPTAFNVWLEIAGGRPPQTLLGLLDEFQGFRISFWGNFGGVNVIAPEWVYTTLDVFTLLAVIGLGIGAVRRTLPGLLWIPALHLAVVFAALVRWTLMTYASQGRLIFPAIAAVAVLMVYGLREIAEGVWQMAGARSEKREARGQETGPLEYERDRRQEAVGGGRTAGARSERTGGGRQEAGARSERREARGQEAGGRRQVRSSTSAAGGRSQGAVLGLAVLLAAFLLCLAVAVPFGLIAPVYALPARMTDEARVPNPVHIRYDAGGVQPELVGYEMPRVLRVGGELPVRLYWRTDAAIGQDLAMYIHMYDAGGELIGQWDAFTGNGLYPTRLWKPNEIVVDEYRVPVRAVEPQQVGRVEVGLTKVGSAIPLAAHDPAGNEITPVIAEFGIYAPTQARDTTPARFVWGDAVDALKVRFFYERGITVGEISPPDPNALVSPLRANDIVRVEYTLRARRDGLEDYTVFAQLVDGNGQVIAQEDAPPRGGAYPTSFWRAGETVSDSLAFTIPADAAPGMYSILFGMYGSRDRVRLPVRGEAFEHVRANGDHLLLSPLELVP